MAKVVREFYGCPDGQPKPQWFNPGDDVTGDLAAVAVREGWAIDADAPAPEPVAVPAAFAAFDRDGDGKPGGSLPKRKRKGR